MTDRRLAGALVEAKALELEARQQYLSTADVSEKDQALVTMRHVTALRKALESWIGVRAVRTQMSR